MQEFPFTSAEWESVNEAALAVTNATLADDAVLRASRFVELQLLLHNLQATYGEHPILLETEADYADGANERIALYERAKVVALREGLPSWSVRIELANLYLDEWKDIGLARQELLACREEVAVKGDEHEKTRWRELLARC
jgi:hypothetical protein